MRRAAAGGLAIALTCALLAGCAEEKSRAVELYERCVAGLTSATLGDDARSLEDAVEECNGQAERRAEREGETWEERPAPQG